MAVFHHKADMGRGWGLWPVLSVLLLAVLVPTGCVLWFMLHAVRNERLAVRQRLTDIYQGEVEQVRDRLEEYWAETAAKLAASGGEGSPGEVFAKLMGQGLCDSAIVRGRDGEDGYPQSNTDSIDRAPMPDGWAAAERLEFAAADPAAAAAAYQAIAEAAGDVNIRARALLATGRCLAKAGRNREAIELLLETLGRARYRDAADAHGRRIALGAGMLALELLSGDPPTVAAMTHRLAREVADYSRPGVPAGQRRLIMAELARRGADVPALRAEELATEYLAAEPPAAEPGVLRPVDSTDLWHIASVGGGVVAVFSAEGLGRRMQMLIDSGPAPPNAKLELLSPGAPGRGKEAFLTIPAGSRLPAWRLAVLLDGSDPFDQAARRQVAAYLWTGGLVIGVIALLALVAAWFVGRQIRLTRLKNDFVATVSHELKTPLASMRVLVDTLLEGRVGQETTRREYLGLIARENERLSRLIDNFLTFSRMERHKQVFDFVEVAPGEIVASAVAATSERFDKPDCHLDVNVPDGLPPVRADRDALITVLLNLLDNAYKYTGADKRIGVVASMRDGAVRFEVSDNGPGLSRRAVKKIFRRFYQVDRSLSRGPGGCGLGLSIVQFIVDAHGGKIDVHSRPGEGSTLTVTIPPASTGEKPPIGEG